MTSSRNTGRPEKISPPPGTVWVFMDMVPGFKTWSTDPTIEAMMHNHDVFPVLAYSFIVGTGLLGAWKWLGLINVPARRPFFVVNKKTWLNSKVPRRRARDYATRFFKPPPD